MIDYYVSSLNATIYYDTDESSLDIGFGSNLGSCPSHGVCKKCPLHTEEKCDLDHFLNTHPALDEFRATHPEFFI